MSPEVAAVVGAGEGWDKPHYADRLLMPSIVQNVLGFPLLGLISVVIRI